MGPEVLNARDLSLFDFSHVLDDKDPRGPGPIFFPGPKRRSQIRSPKFL